MSDLLINVIIYNSTRNNNNNRHINKIDIFQLLLFRGRWKEEEEEKKKSSPEFLSEIPS